MKTLHIFNAYNLLHLRINMHTLNHPYHKHIHYLPNFALASNVTTVIGIIVVRTLNIRFTFLANLKCTVQCLWLWALSWADLQNLLSCKTTTVNTLTYTSAFPSPTATGNHHCTLFDLELVAEETLHTDLTLVCE